MKRSKTTKRLRIFAMLTILYLSQSCAVPQPVSRLSPLESNFEWLKGTENLLFESPDGLQVALQYLHSTSAHLVFEVGVQNRSQENVLIDPLQISILPIGLDTISPLGSPISAVNPENELLRLDIQTNREEAEQSNDAAMELLSQGLNLASDIASSGQEKDPEVQEREQADRQERRADYEYTQAISEERLLSLDDRRHYWANYTLRKTTLKPGYEIRGTVFFPRQNSATFLKVWIHLGKHPYSALYRQWLYK
jgi:hypothetical protein